MLLFLMFCCSISNAMVLDGVENIDYRFEPQVAFRCGYASMYLTEDGWQTDLQQNVNHSQSCVSSAEDVLAYCSWKYSEMNITNVIPSPKHQNLKWTALIGSSEEEFSVRPYRCIVGKFTSELIVVPNDECKYGNTSASSAEHEQCATYFEWNSTAHERCDAAKLELYSFDVVETCGVGKFKAVEYVCCPSSSTKTSESNAPTSTATATASTAGNDVAQISSEQQHEEDYEYTFDEDDDDDDEDEDDDDDDEDDGNESASEHANEDDGVSDYYSSGLGNDTDRVESERQGHRTTASDSSLKLKEVETKLINLQHEFERATFQMTWLKVLCVCEAAVVVLLVGVVLFLIVKYSSCNLCRRYVVKNKRASDVYSAYRPLTVNSSFDSTVIRVE